MHPVLIKKFCMEAMGEEDDEPCKNHELGGMHSVFGLPFSTDGTSRSIRAM
jgi:hypothetical protein